ncbi:hypothetical protein V8E54_002330 [Elaphomyces granulatus]
MSGPVSASPPIVMAEPLLMPEEIMLPPSPPESCEPSDQEQATNGFASSDEISKRLLDFTTTLSLPSTTSGTPRNTTPFTRIHSRSRSLAIPLAAPPMTRAHSSPGLDSRGRYLSANSPRRPLSPMDHSTRRHSPLRMADDQWSFNMGSLNISETITEHAELENALDADPIDLERSQAPSPLSPSMHHTFPRPVRRRPSSPLHSSTAGAGGYTASNPSSSTSPVMLPMKYNEPFPGVSVSSASSMPSTPTSFRSRSPSISSLETIPDIPDAEAAAIEADRIAKLKAAAEKADADSTRRQSNIDTSNSFSFGSMRGLGGYGMRADKRKRWSVCGAERRQDLDLETIWED